MPSHRGKRSYNGNKKREARNAQYQQQETSRNYITDNQYKDQVIGETVNLVTTSAILGELTQAYPEASDKELTKAVPNVDPGDVLDVPNRYHLELFVDCNEFSGNFNE